MRPMSTRTVSRPADFMPLRSYITHIARPYLLAAVMAFSSTLLKWCRPLRVLISDTKRCMNTPSMPYSRIQRKWVSTVL